jgi:hypothetical protein
MNNEGLEKGCLYVVGLVVCGALACYCDYYYRLSIVKEAIKQTQQESKK